MRRLPKRGEVWFYQVDGFPAWAYWVKESAIRKMVWKDSPSPVQYMPVEYEMAVRAIDPNGRAGEIHVVITEQEQIRWRPFDGEVPNHWPDYNVPDPRVLCCCGKLAKLDDYLCESCR